MKIVNIHEAKSQLSKLIERAEAGEEIMIARAGKPVAKLVAYRDQRTTRTGGQWRGKVRLSPDFDVLPDDTAGAFGITDT
ncbi:MAG TPA: type II toxin-antitoxin system prevent-host-death family antitoxin [Pirellulales bacterium]|nr:type II toxin-antitoxin system prevent-host-death family antitoxin [Pirellulales bacterium]